MHEIFLRYSADKLRQLENRIEVCLEKLTDEQIWMRHGDTENAIGNLVMHLCGNVRQWIVSAAGGEPDHRRRDQEFAARNITPRAELISLLQQTIADAAAVIQKQDAASLVRIVRIQNYDVSVLEAIYHAVEHFSHHTGQILFATKSIVHADLGFYRHLQGASHQEKTP